MSQMKLLASDLDGTILFERSVSLVDAAAIRQWRDAGNLAVCATGKSLRATQHALTASGLHFDYYVLYTGAVICDSDYQVLYEEHLPQQVVAPILEFLTKQENIAIFATTLDSKDLQVWNSVPEHLSTDILQTFDPITIEELLNLKVVGIPMWVPGSSERVAALATDLKKHFGDSVDVHINQDFIDIVPPHSDKGRGLTWLGNHLESKYPQLRTYSMGDSYNDLHMHKWADVATAFPHSPQEVQLQAGHVYPTAADFIHAILAEEL